MNFDPQDATITPEKLRDYLLSPLHMAGRQKAAFFSSLGYSRESWETLEKDIRSLLVAVGDPVKPTEYGQKYAVRGSLKGPNGREACIVTIWIILNGETSPRLVTAYPDD
jgi:hypothetical protein